MSLFGAWAGLCALLFLPPGRTVLSTLLTGYFRLFFTDKVIDIPFDRTRGKGERSTCYTVSLRDSLRNTCRPIFSEQKEFFHL